MEGLSGRSSVEEWLNGTTDVCFCNMLVLTLNSNGPCGSRLKSMVHTCIGWLGRRGRDGLVAPQES